LVKIMAVLLLLWLVCVGEVVVVVVVVRLHGIIRNVAMYYVGSSSS
jgi:hypothetical protein